jgi:hypothetical protein
MSIVRARVRLWQFSVPMIKIFLLEALLVAGRTLYG